MTYDQIVKKIEKNGGLAKLAETTGLTQTDVLRAIRDFETAENVRKIAHALGLSVAEIKGRKK